MPANDPNSGGVVKADRLEDLIGRWKSLRQRIEALFDAGSPSEEALAPLRERRANIVDRIQRLVKNNPRLRDDAIDMGFRADLLQDYNSGGGTNEPPRDPDDLGGQPQGGGGGGGGDGSGDGDDKTKPPKDGKGGGDTNPRVGSKGLLPKGKKVYQYKGKTYVTWKYKIRGNVFEFAWFIPDKDLKTYGIKKGEGQHLSDKQANKMELLGNIGDFVVDVEDDMFRQWVKKVVRKYEGTDILDNDEVLGIFMESFAENWTSDELQNQLRLSKWWDSKTRYQRRWETELTSAERKKTLASTEQDIKNALADLYGDNWRTHVKGGQKKVREWAEKIASGKMGAMGNPDSGFQTWLSRVKRDAESIAETPAWIAKKQEEIADKEFLNQPEDMQAQLREQSIQWLGYGYTPDRDTLAKWAEDLVFERRSDADWQQYLRRQKQALHPWLDPDETWMDGMSAYKSVADQILGTSLSWRDKLFADILKKGEDGAPMNDGTTRMSSWDFEKLVKSDSRFWGSKTARDEVEGFRAFLDEKFHGVPA